MTVTLYEENYEYDTLICGFTTKFYVVDDDTFTLAQRLDEKYREFCGCLNFASHKRPGGGYKAVQDIRGPIRTQEEDLFRRSDLPELMDIPKVKEQYPLRGLKALYTVATVLKDKNLNPLTQPFETGIITMPAVVNPSSEDEPLVKAKIRRILEIAAENYHTTIILGAWGCGIFNNDPKNIALYFQECFDDDFAGVFKEVFFAIPGASSTNHQTFKEVFEGTKT